jgi:hypothetical protein
MGRRDYEMEAAVAAVEGRVTEPVGRALIVGAPGSQEGTLGGALNSLQPVVVQMPAHRFGADDDPGSRRRDRQQAVANHRPPPK